MNGNAWRLDGRVALVTGSSSGIGRAVAEVLAGAGARVVVHTAEALAAEAGEVAAGLPDAVPLALDLGAPGSGARLAQAARDAAGEPEILVLAASVQVEAAWDVALPEDMDRQWAVNLRETLTLTQALVPAMVGRGWGRVVGISSVQALRPHPMMMVYAGTKAAMVNMLRNLAKQVAGQGVTANLIAPGAIDTPRNAVAFADPAYRTRVLDRIPAGRLGRAEDCAGAALFLCTDAAAYVTGAEIPVDGGLAL